ncbi:MAG: hypothetical protein HC774_06185, partial [Sphingomonadales bacterium]|nr:hypothetical protein [Sphingomonadales bacterium]
MARDDDPGGLWDDVLGPTKSLRWRLLTQPQPTELSTSVQLAAAAVAEALAQAGIAYDRIEQACVGYVYGDSTAGQAALYPIGMSGIPVFNVNNNCATGSSALYLARQAILSGAAQCVLALGFEQMRPGALRSQWIDRTDPLERFLSIVDERFGPSEAPMALRLFGGAAMDYQVTMCVPENITPERKRILRAYGAELVFTNPLEGSDGAIRMAQT